MSLSDSDGEFFDARDEVSSPRSCQKPVSELVSSLKEAKSEISLPTVPDNEPKQKEEVVPESKHENVMKNEHELTLEQEETNDEQVLDNHDEPDSSKINVEPDKYADGDSNSQIGSPKLDDKNTTKRKEMTPTITVENTPMSGQKPDLLACVQDRPTNLPGVKPVDVITRPTMPPPPPPGPRKIPPSRPAPPKRPPPPKRTHLTARSAKPYLNETDDGLLTPNSTVDNLTREFTEALKHDRSINKQQANEESIHTDSPEFMVSHEVSTKTIEQTEHSSHIGSASTVNTHTSPSSSLRREEDILASVIVKNLDTGESMPLSTAAEHVSQFINPLALQIMSRTKEFSYSGGSNNSTMSSHDGQMNTASAISQSVYVDSDSLSIASDDIDIGKDASQHKHKEGKKLKSKSKKFKKMVGKGVSKVKVAAGTQVEKAVQKVKHVKDEVTHTDQLNVSSDEDSTEFGSSSTIKVKAASSNKGPYQLSHPKQIQDIAVHVGAVWCMKFSHCGRLLATSGQDNVIWVWVLKDFYNYFNDMRNKYDNKDDELFNASSMKHVVHSSSSNSSEFHQNSEDDVFNSEPQMRPSQLEEDEEEAPFRQVPFSSYVGHAADVLDLAWSKNFFILSSSMDKTVRLWHISRKECLCCFQHIDFVTAIAFHPRDDRYFLSGSLDSKLRLWNIPDKKVALWNEVSPDGSSSSGSVGGALITTVNFCENGKFAVCGTYDGRCIFFDTEHLKYHTQIHVRSSRGRNTKGHKITGIEPLQGEHKILVTSNDSRVRLYDLRDLSLVCKYKGHTNLSSQIKASFSPDSKYIICGSEDKCVYMWRTSLPQDVTKLSSLRRDRNDSWESMKAHDAVVTCSVFAPHPQLLYKNDDTDNNTETKTKSKPQSILSLSSKKHPQEVNVIVSADFNGCIKVIVSGQ
ncbi:WD repeat-containing protein 44-like isoform X1 [Styela clava]